MISSSEHTSATLAPATAARIVWRATCLRRLVLRSMRQPRCRRSRRAFVTAWVRTLTSRRGEFVRQSLGLSRFDGDRHKAPASCRPPITNPHSGPLQMLAYSWSWPRRALHRWRRGQALQYRAEGGDLALADRDPRRRRVQDADDGANSGVPTRSSRLAKNRCTVVLEFAGRRRLQRLKTRFASRSTDRSRRAGAA